MARGNTLANIVAMVKGELLLIASDEIAPGGDATLKAMVDLQQKWLALRYEWPFLTKQEEINMVAGTRYYDFPQAASVDVFDLGRQMMLECYDHGLWNPMEYGIDIAHYNALDPELGIRSDPVLRWQFYRTTTVQFEVWPLPSFTTRIRMTGQMLIPTLAADADACVLDDILIAQFTAAKLAARLKSGDAAALLAQAQETLRQLRAGYSNEVPTFNTSGVDMPPRNWDRPTVVAFSP